MVLSGRSLGAFSLLAAVLAALLLASTAAGARPAARLVPQTGTLFGAWVDSSYGSWAGWDQRREAEITEIETAIGRRLDISHHFYSWTTPFPSRLETWDAAGGRTSLVSWGGERDFPGLDAILAGRFDALIRERARSMRALGREVFLRFGWEMNGSWSRWGGAVNNDPETTNGPAKYVAAWRHLHDLFAAEGATNVVWVWAPNSESIPDADWNHWTRYYPGDAYVDWVGIDGYNWGRQGWRTLAEIIGPVYRTYAARKPIMVAETGTVEEGGDKRTWFASASSALKQSFPGVAAFVYFHSTNDGDWRVTTSPAALAAYRAMALDPYFNPRVDVTPPALVSLRPVQKKRIVRSAAEVTAVATEQLDCTTVTAATVTVRPAVPVRPTCSGRTISLRGTALAPATRYTVIVGTGVRDPAGNGLRAPARWSFVTR